jgi:hypothetical protein
MKRSLAISLGCVISAFAAANAPADWNGPLFGLATAPNGDVLVADAGAGVIEYPSGELFRPLPGITDIAPIGRSSLWATRNGADGTGETDSGQALLRVSRGQARVLANLFEFEAAFNPHPANVQSNPFDVEALGGEAALVADAAGNDLLRIDDEGQVEVLAIFPTRLASTASLQAALGCPGSGLPVCFLPPNMPSEAVPTSIAVSPDGYYYVGELRGFPGPLDQSRIWRVAPWASWANCGSSPDCEVAFDGDFTSIIDMGFSPDGLLYVVEFDEVGWFAAEVLGLPAGGTVNACDPDSHACIEVATDIPFVTAITFGKHGEIWATRNAVIPPLASVVRID